MTYHRRLEVTHQNGVRSPSGQQGFQGVRGPDGAGASPESSPAPADLAKFSCVSASGCKYFGAPRMLLAQAEKNGASGLTPTTRTKVAALLKDIADPDDDVSGRALNELGEMGPAAESAVPSLARILDGPSVSRKLLAVQVLGKIGSERAVRELVRVVEDKRIPNWALSAAIAGLEQAGPKARPAVPALGKVLLKDSDPKMRRAAAYALGAIGSPRAESVLTQRMQREDDQDVRRAITFALGTIRSAQGAGTMLYPREQLKDLIADLADSHLGTRYRAIRVLSDMGSDAEGAVPALTKIVLDRGERLPYFFFTVRCEAAKALGEIGSEKAVPALVKVIEAKPSGVGGQQVRRDAIVALQMLGKKARGATRTLERVVENRSEDQELRYAAIVALYLMETRAVAPTLRRALQDGDPRVRGTAAFALGWIGDREAMGELARAKGDPDDYVRSMAEHAIKTLSANGGTAPHQPSPRARASLQELIEKLKDQNPSVRLQALKDLGERGEEGIGAIPAIKGALGDKDPRVRAAAAQALGTIGASIMNLGKKGPK